MKPHLQQLQSTSLLRGKTAFSTFHKAVCCASIHFPLAREDYGAKRCDNQICCFNPLPSCEGRPPRHIPSCQLYCFNPLPSCEGRQGRFRWGIVLCNASIHFPLAREDIQILHFFDSVSVLQSTSLLRGKTKYGSAKRGEDALQSTSLLRGKTNSHPNNPHTQNCFNPLPSCEGRRNSTILCFHVFGGFNPLPSCEGRHSPVCCRYSEY